MHEDVSIPGLKSKNTLIRNSEVTKKKPKGKP